MAYFSMQKKSLSPLSHKRGSLGLHEKNGADRLESMKVTSFFLLSNRNLTMHNVRVKKASFLSQAKAMSQNETNLFFNLHSDMKMNKTIL